MEFVIEDREFEQIKLVVQEFRGIEYLHIRKYYLDFDEEWKPTKEGVSMPISIENTRNLMRALITMLSDAESKSILEEHFLEVIQDLYK